MFCTMFSDGIRLVESVLIEEPLMLGRVMIPVILAIIPPCLPPQRPLPSTRARDICDYAPSRLRPDSRGWMELGLFLRPEGG
jgi:hypothetical protein